MKFLVTGSSGFIGSNFQKYFDNKSIHELHRGEEFPNHGEEVVIHLAGKSHDLKNISAPNEYYNVNSELTKKVFDAFLASDAKLFIAPSSVKAIADQFEGELTQFEKRGTYKIF